MQKFTVHGLPGLISPQLPLVLMPTSGKAVPSEYGPVQVTEGDPADEMIVTSSLHIMLVGADTTVLQVNEMCSPAVAPSSPKGGMAGPGAAGLPLAPV